MPGAIAAVITADLNYVSVSSKFRPANQTTAGWIINEIAQTIIIGPISP